MSRTATGVSADGKVVIGGSTESDNGQEQAFRYSRERDGLGFPPGDNWTIANGVNADGLSWSVRAKMRSAANFKHSAG
jgi:probable HAF family extracellular repeat protein